MTGNDLTGTAALPERASGLERIWARLTAWGVHLEAGRAAEQEQARPLFAELMVQPEDRRLATIVGDARYRTLAVADRLLQATERASAAATRANTELALAILERLDAGRYGASTLSGRQAVAWCHQADARRRQGDLEAAESGFRHAAGRLAGELLDAWERAVYCRRLAALRRDQERDDEALGLLQRAVELCRAWGETLLAADALCDMADLWLAADDPETALHRFLEARDDAETPAAVPYVAIRVQHGLARCHAQLGERAKADRLLRDVQPLYRLLSPVERLRCLRAEARIHEENGHPSRAQSLLRPLVARMIEEGAFLDAALAALDLAQLAAERGQIGDVRRLADPMAPLLAADRLPDPASSVLRFALHFASHLRPGVVEVLTQASDVLERSRENPRCPIPWAEEEVATEIQWDDLPLARKRTLCEEAGLPAAFASRTAAALAPSDRQLITWTHQVEARVRVRFEPTDEKNRDVAKLR